MNRDTLNREVSGRVVGPLMAIALLAVGCSQPADQPGSADFQTALVDEPDGRASFYSGFFIADKLAAGADLESLDNHEAFLRVRVPQAMLDGASAAPTRRTVISLEESHPDVEILMHVADPQLRPERRITHYALPIEVPMKNTTYLPGEPWLSGHAQVVVDDFGRFTSGVHILKYSGTQPMSTDDLSWGMVDCRGEPDCPALRYSNQNVCLWPPLPPEWTAVLLMNHQTTLDFLCHGP